MSSRGKKVRARRLAKEAERAEWDARIKRSDEAMQEVWAWVESIRQRWTARQNRWIHKVA